MFKNKTLLVTGGAGSFGDVVLFIFVINIFELSQPI
jgi:FlaA1/EpsC-like NDP-sugar epimerase